MKKKLSIVIGLIVSQWASGASFQINEFGADVMGAANSGTGVSNKASVQYFNPAGMVNTDSNKISGAITAVLPKANMKAISASDINGANILWNSSQSGPNEDAYVPNIYAIYHITDKFAAGLGVVSPWGLKTQYEKDSVARYFATLSSLMTINVNPSLAYKINDMFSVGVGFNAQYADANLNSTFKHPASTDVQVRNHGDDWGYGYNLGVQFTPIEKVKLGLSYRSKIAYNLEGKTDLLGEAGAVTAAGGILGTFDGAKVRVNTEMPDVTILSASFQATPKLNLLLDLQHTRWNRLDDLRVISSDTELSRMPLNYSNTVRTSVGAEYALNNKVTFRAGYANDPSPTNRWDRTMRIPDSDRDWYSLGVNFKPKSNVDIDVAYMFVNFKGEAEVVDDSALATAITASFKGHAHVAGVQATYSFS